MSTPAPFLTATWRHLVMLNYEVPEAALAPFVPRGTELDRFDGRLLASLVGFRFLDTRVLGVPVPFHRDFDEVNLRFYVRFRGPEGWRRGAVFVKEIVPRAAIALVARLVYNERYVRHAMRHRITASDADFELRDADRWQGLGVTVHGDPALPAPGSEEEFITEHYWGYSAQRDGGTVEYHVAHPPWRVWRAAASRCTLDVPRLYGPAFAEALAAPPTSAFMAEGSAVTVYRGQRIA